MIVGRNMRNSNIELLRLSAMLMIVGFHYIINNPDMSYIIHQPVTFTKFIYQFIYMGGGWVGNFIFFVISAWFLLDWNLSLKDSLRRVWLLERELLFWSVILMVVLVIARREGFYHEGVLRLLPKTVFPLLTSMWWYPTSYALFLILLPFVALALQKIGRKNHLKLAIGVLVLWGAVALVPFPAMNLDLDSSSVFVFIYWLVLISYCKWNMNISSKNAIILIISGLLVELIYWSAASLFFTITGKKPGFQNFIFDHWKLPTMMIGFGLFILCYRHPFHSRFVNYLAASSFGVYLIHYQPGIYRMWTGWFPLKDVYTSAHPILQGAIIVVSVFLICLALDLIRQTIFRATIDRHAGKWFEHVYARIEPKISRITNARCFNMSSTPMSDNTYE